MQDLDQLLHDNRIELTIEYDFGAILCWKITMWQYGINQEPKKILQDQYFTYAEMRLEVIKFLLEENRR